MPAYVIGRKAPGEVRAAVDGFAPAYVRDWDSWLAADQVERPAVFGQILRRWQATRPKPMRRTKRDADHGPPFLEDLLDTAADHVHALGDLTIAGIGRKTPGQVAALLRLWDTFEQLTTVGAASCVGISKAVLLVSDGRIGPALDSTVRAALGVSMPVDGRSWLRVLAHVGEDIGLFEAFARPARRGGPTPVLTPWRRASLRHGARTKMTGLPHGQSHEPLHETRDPCAMPRERR